MKLPTITMLFLLLASSIGVQGWSFHLRYCFRLSADDLEPWLTIDLYWVDFTPKFRLKPV